MQETILITGGLGYIGSHTALRLLELGYRVVIVDNLSNSKPTTEAKIRKVLNNPELEQNLHVHIVDLIDTEALRTVFQSYKFDGVIHFAALKAVGESCQQPLRYYRNNINATFNLFSMMEEFGVTKLIFSSSATVYGSHAISPYKEENAFLAKSSSPYGQTKINIEYMIQDICAVTNLRAISLRYFNPVGAHPSGLLGEELIALNNIFPYLSAVYLGNRPELVIFGDDYETPDGTCQRDYIHIMDLVEGHILAYKYLNEHPEVRHDAFNLGTGAGISTLELCKAFQEYGDRPIKYRFGERRAGDLAVMYADPSKAQRLLGFQAQKTVRDMVEDTIRFLQTYENSTTN